MGKLKIGVHLEALGLPLRRGLEEAARLGVSGVKVNAVGDLAPGNLSQTGRREFRNVLRARGLELASLGCPLRHGLDTPDNMEPRIAHIQQVMALAYDLGPRLVTIQAGAVPEKEEDPARGLLREALTILAAHGDRIGTILALESGLESGERLAQFLSQIHTGSLGVLFDPANQLLNGFRPHEDAHALAGKIVQVQAKDARKSGPSRAAQEVPLGHGDLDWMQLLADLEERDYSGWIVVHREAGTRRVQDVQEGVNFLRRFVG